MTTLSKGRAFPLRCGIPRPRQARNSKLFVRKVKRPCDTAPCSGNIPTRRYGQHPNRGMCAISSGGEHHLDTVGVASSNLASRTIETRKAPLRVPFSCSRPSRAPVWRGPRAGRHPCGRWPAIVSARARQSSPSSFSNSWWPQLGQAGSFSVSLVMRTM